VLHAKEDHIWNLTSCFRKKREWGPVLGEDLAIDGDMKLEMNESENEPHLEI
jgi:hypothetical protein